MRQVKPIPQTMKLAPTLAQRVFQLREFRNLTVRDLARLCRFPPQRIEEIEAGMETWFSSTDRQLLAKALCVEPAVIQEVETRPRLEDPLALQEVSDRLTSLILGGARDLQCPACGHSLRCSIQEGFDIEGQPIGFAKAFCTRCPFV